MSSAVLISMFGIVLISIAVLFFHILLIKYCMGNRNVAAQVKYCGVEEKILQTIPIFAFADVKRDIDQDECAVCLGELQDEEKVRLLPNCKHAFHVKCIDQWLAEQSSCPLCRSPVVTFPEDTESEPNSDDVDATDPDREIDDQPSTTNDYRIRESSVMEHSSPPVDRRPWPPRLKRSVSMDPSLIGTNLLRNLSTLRRSDSYSGVPFSSKWLRSFSRLRVGNGTPNGAILPY